MCETDSFLFLTFVCLCMEKTLLDSWLMNVTSFYTLYRDLPESSQQSEFDIDA